MKSKIKTLRKKCQKAWSKKVRERDRLCIWCGNHGPRLHSHHIVARSLCNFYGWVDPLNGMTLCFRCHFFRLKAEVDEYIKIRDSYLTEKDLTYQELREMYRPIAKLKIDDYEYLLNKLQGL